MTAYFEDSFAVQSLALMPSGVRGCDDASQFPPRHGVSVRPPIMPLRLSEAGVHGLSANQLRFAPDRQHYRRTAGASRLRVPRVVMARHHGGPLPCLLQFLPAGFPQRVLAGQHHSHDGSPAAARAANYAPPRLECCRICSVRPPSVLGGLPGWGLLCRPFSSQVGRLPLQEYLTQLHSQTAEHWFRAGFCLHFATPFSPPFTRAITHHRGSGGGSTHADP